MRIAGLRSPPIETRATPDTCEIAGMRKLSAFSWTTVSGSVSERNERVRMGGSAGLILRKVGGVDIACGNDFPAAVIAACTRSEEHTSELQSHRDLHSFPTRRSSDLEGEDGRIGRIDLAEGRRRRHRLRQ